MRVLVIEDNLKLANVIKVGLEERHYLVDVCHDGEDGLHYASTEPYELIILDLMLPKVDGMEILRSVRQRGVDTPVLILTAKGSVDDRIRGLDSGADEYIAKPFVFGELMARIRALLRRARAIEPMRLTAGDMVLDLEKHEAIRAGTNVKLTPKEFLLLRYFMQNADRVLTRTSIAEHVWDMNFSGFSNVIDVRVNALRKKIDHGFDVPLIHTVRGVGYVLRTPK
ncbi:MAG: response regulator transcription factor [Planctomycetes bacterium]|nr:response regulator transcription factor [Planctomycetota bacterium]